MKFSRAKEFSDIEAKNIGNRSALTELEEAAEKGRVEGLGAQAAKDAAAAKAKTLLGQMRSTRQERKDMSFSARWESRKTGAEQKITEIETKLNTWASADGTWHDFT